ncbi:DUF1847 domain-containing protein [[Eubacterium] cellulosolvens]
MILDCAHCDNKKCYDGKDCTKLRQRVEQKYEPSDIKSMKVSASIEAKYYMKKTRLEELILYAKDMGYKRLGLAFCIGLAYEAQIIHEILAHDFIVHSVCCKVCGIDKSTFELKRLHPEKEIDATCNPLGQAEVLNQEKTELNIILGLCIGHDILFTKYSKAPVTTVGVKDRVLAHNPLGAIYSNYYLEKVFQMNRENEKRL